MPKSFVKNVEDFTCKNCGTSVKGTGYTDHCPNCLWSKHVDINPGDRFSTCLGMMKPMKIVGKTNHYSVLNVCQKCKYEKKNKLSTEDSDDAVLFIVQASTCVLEGK